MINTFFAKKIRMSGRFDAQGNRRGVTLLQLANMTVLDTRSKEKHGYVAVRVKIAWPKSKPMIREIRNGEDEWETGQEIKAEELITAGDKLNIAGTSKGKGFAGAVKRWGFKGGPRTHGQSDRERAPGSSGSTTTPGRVYKGKRRAGHMGNEKVTIAKLKVLEVNPENKIVTVIGAVPGANNFGILTINKAL